MSPFTQGDRLLARDERQERAESPHPVLAAKLGAVDQRRHSRRIAHQPRHAAGVAHGREPLGLAGRAAIGALEHPVRRRQRAHAGLFRWFRTRSASRVEKPGTVASSATEADLHAGEAAEPLEQLPAPVGSDTGNVEQLRRDRARGAPLPVVGQAEAVSLVAGPLQQPERRAPPRQPEALRAPGHEHLLLALGEAHHRHRRHAGLRPSRRARR